MLPNITTKVHTCWYHIKSKVTPFPLWKLEWRYLDQGYSNGGPRSESGPFDGDWRTSSASQRFILHPKVFILKPCAFGRACEHRRTGSHFTGGRKKFALKIKICPKNKKFALKLTCLVSSELGLKSIENLFYL